MKNKVLTAGIDTLDVGLCIESYKLSDVEINALRYAEEQGGRTALGVDVFRKIFTDNTLYAVVGKELKPVRHFKPDVFFRVWSHLHSICTQEDKMLINLDTIE